jgi:hypothetical protein
MAATAEPVSSKAVGFDQALNNDKTAARGGRGLDVLRAEVAWVSLLAKNGFEFHPFPALTTSTGDGARAERPEDAE